MLALLFPLLLTHVLTLLAGLLILHKLTQIFTILSHETTTLRKPASPSSSTPLAAQALQTSELDAFHQAQELDEILKSRQIDEGIENLMTYTVQTTKLSAR